MLLARVQMRHSFSVLGVPTRPHLHGRIMLDRERITRLVKLEARKD